MQWHCATPEGSWPAPSLVHQFLSRVGSTDSQVARSHIERVLRRSGGFIVLGYTHTNDIKWARRVPDTVPGVPTVQADRLGKLPREARMAIVQAMQRADSGKDDLGDAYRAALLARSIVARAALVGRLAEL